MISVRKVLIIFCIILSSCKKDEFFDINLIIRNHKFEPEIIYAPSMKKIKLHITNMDDTIEEFESIDLKREKIIPSKSTVTVILAPLKKGEYKFFGEFHEDSAQGKIIIGNE
jgi:hypothetical protein